MCVPSHVSIIITTTESWLEIRKYDYVKLIIQILKSWYFLVTYEDGVCKKIWKVIFIFFPL